MRTVASPIRFMTGAISRLELVAVRELDDLGATRVG